MLTYVRSPRRPRRPIQPTHPGPTRLSNESPTPTRRQAPPSPTQNIDDAQRRLDDRNQAYRRRLLDGMARALVDAGLSEVTVADVVRHARVSRRTFYEQFEDRANCFQALVETLAVDLRTALTESIDRTAPPEMQVQTAVAAAFRVLAKSPALTVSAIRELPSLGSLARAAHHRLLDTATEGLIILISRGSTGADGEMLPQRRAIARMAVGSLCEIAADTLERSDDLNDQAEGVARVLCSMLWLGTARSTR